MSTDIRIKFVNACSSTAATDALLAPAVTLV